MPLQRIDWTAVLVRLADDRLVTRYMSRNQDGRPLRIALAEHALYKLDADTATRHSDNEIPAYLSVFDGIQWCTVDSLTVYNFAALPGGSEVVRTCPYDPDQGPLATYEERWAAITRAFAAVATKFMEITSLMFDPYRPDDDASGDRGEVGPKHDPIESDWVWGGHPRRVAARVALSHAKRSGKRVVLYYRDQTTLIEPTSDMDEIVPNLPLVSKLTQSTCHTVFEAADAGRLPHLASEVFALAHETAQRVLVVFGDRAVVVSPDGTADQVSAAVNGLAKDSPDEARVVDVRDIARPEVAVAAALEVLGRTGKPVTLRNGSAAVEIEPGHLADDLPQTGNANFIEVGDDQPPAVAVSLAVAKATELNTPVKLRFRYWTVTVTPGESQRDLLQLLAERQDEA